MSREIKFRARDANGKWIYGHYAVMCGVDDTSFPVIFDEGNSTPVDIYTLSQYTGINDVNGLEIYDGFVVRRTSDQLGGEEITGVVKMLEGCWFIDSGSNALRLWTESDINEVIGNIYENPELLEVN